MCFAQHIESRKGYTPYDNVGYARTQGDMNWDDRGTHARTLFSRMGLQNVFCPLHVMDRTSIRGR